jgi:hypothetical protein
VEAVKLGRFRISLEGLGLALLTLALFVSVARCDGRQEGRDAERLAQLERNAYKSSLANIAARRATDSVVAANRIAERSLIARVAANRKVEARLSATLAANDSLLSAHRLNPADDDSVYALKTALARTSEVALLFRDSTEVILTQVADLLSANEAERRAWLAERESNTNLVAEKDKIIEHLRKQARCRVFGVPCLTRVQSGMVGAGSILLLLTLL